MALYKYIKAPDGSTATYGILRTTDNAYVPNDMKNHDWVAYQTWLGSGNTPDPA